VTDEHPADERLVEYLETGAVDLEPEVAADLDAVRAELAEAATWEEPRAGLEDEIVALLLAEPQPDSAGDEPATQAPRPNAAGAAPSAPVVSLADARVRRSRAVAVVASIVAAAAVVVAVIGFASRPPANNSESANGPTGTTTARPGDRKTIGPGVEATLNATDLLPGASGTVRLDETDSGVWIRMDASGLPRRDDGAFYQAWVKTPQGLVPIGTFHTGDDVVLWSGIPIADTDAVTVTLEENDGNQDSSGQRVLVATIPHAGNTGGTSGPGGTAGTGRPGGTAAPPATSPR
jgi:hypothetical protein